MKENTRQSKRFRRLRIFWHRNYAILILLPLLTAIVFYAFCLEPSFLKIKSIEFDHAAIDHRLDGVRIVFISDLHIRPTEQAKLQKLVAAANRLNPDLILLGGDFINGNGNSLPLPQLLEELQKLSAPLGVYAIPGNHEYRHGIEAVAGKFNTSSIRLLQDQNIVLHTASGGTLNLIGLDYHSNPAKQQDPDRLKNLFSEKHFNLVFTHTPEDFKYLSSNAHLTLAGHTHGGQISVPLLGSLVNPVYGRDFSYGSKKSGAKTMFISCGVSSAYLTCRLAMPPEIVLITLKSSNKK